MRLSATLPAILLCAASSPALASDHGWAQASTIVEIALVSSAAGVPLAQGDGRGAREAGMSVGAAFLVTQGLKEAFPEQRPDHSNNNSFPSGHTALSFAAAASLQERQGWRVGVPAHIAAAFVGLARVEAHKHYWYDVAVGAAIGEVSGRLLTSHPARNVAIIPWGDAHGGGVALAARF